MLIYWKRFRSSVQATVLLLCTTGLMCGGPRTAATLSSLSQTDFHLTGLREGVLTRLSTQAPESSGGNVLGAAQNLERALAQGQKEKAHELLLEILERPHLDSDFLLRLGIRLAERELYPEAAQVFERCVQEHPAIFEAYYDLALADFAQQKWADALATLERAPRGSKAETVACSYLRGKIEDSEGKTPEAEHDLSAAFEGAPQNETYGLDLGLFYIRHQSYPEATAVFERAERWNPQSSFLLLGVSLGRFLAGQGKQSEADLKKLLTMQPDLAPAQLLMTFVLLKEGKLADAEKAASQALRFPHPSPYLYYLDASILVKLQSRQYTRIFKELRDAQNGIPSCSLCYMTESKAHQAQGDVEAAIVDLQDAVRIDPGFPEAWYRLANLYRLAGRPEDASEAQDRFQNLKADQEERETQLLRENFLKAVEASRPAQ